MRQTLSPALARSAGAGKRASADEPPRRTLSTAQRPPPATHRSSRASRAASAPSSLSSKRSAPVSRHSGGCRATKPSTRSIAHGAARPRRRGRMRSGREGSRGAQRAVQRGRARRERDRLGRRQQWGHEPDRGSIPRAGELVGKVARTRSKLRLETSARGGLPQAWVMADDAKPIEINVGGRIFATTVGTLRFERESMLARLFDPDRGFAPLRTDSAGGRSSTATASCSRSCSTTCGAAAASSARRATRRRSALRADACPRARGARGRRERRDRARGGGELRAAALPRGVHRDRVGRRHAPVPAARERGGEARLRDAPARGRRATPAATARGTPRRTAAAPRAPRAARRARPPARRPRDRRAAARHRARARRRRRAGRAAPRRRPTAAPANPRTAPTRSGARPHG